MSMHWLHLSDIHFHGKDAWRDTRAREELLIYLKLMFDNGDIARPDLVFCTGDIAFGETKAEALKQQYESAKDFFTRLMDVCGLPISRLFVVPGNHDVNRDVVDEDAQAALVALAQESRIHMARVNQRLETKPNVFLNAMKRLQAYQDFVQEFLPHQFDKEGRCFFTALIDVQGKKLGIAGFNSAWSCAGPEDDRNLWLGAEWQFKRAWDQLKAADIKFGLIHHPIDWLNVAEREVATPYIARDFDFWLHGHAHNAWVEALGNHVRIGAGAVGAEVSAEFGINLVKLHLDDASIKSEVHLHQYSGGWTIQPIAGLAPRGIWPFALPERVRGQMMVQVQAKPSETAEPEPTATPEPSTTPAPKPTPAPTSGASEDVPRPRLFGRDALLKQCAQKLAQKSALILYGMRGNGKSALLDALDAYPPLAGKTRIRLQALPEMGANDIFRAVAWSLGEEGEFPIAPKGDAKAIAADLLRRYPQPAKPIYLHLDRAHVLLKGDTWQDVSLRQFLLGLQSAYGANLPLVLELRERPSPGLLGAAAHEIEVPGLDRNSMGEMLAASAPAGQDWHYKGDELRRLFGWIGAGDGKNAHPLTLTLLIEVARGLRQSPREVLYRHSDALEEKIEDKLLHDLYRNVLNGNEQKMIETLALYRSHIPHDHVDWLESKLDLLGAWDGLHKRCLLASDAKGQEYYLHSFIAAWLRKRQGYVLQEEDALDDLVFAANCDDLQQARVRERQMAIAECWLQQLGGGKRRTQLNMDRAMEAFHHLLAAGEGDKINAVAVELLSGKLDWALKKIQGFYRHLFEARAPITDQAKALEYWLRLDPQEPKAWRFLGECHVKMEGRGSAKALACFEEACKLLPSYAKYWANLGRAMLEHGPASAQVFLDKLAMLEREYPSAIDGHVTAVRADCEKMLGNLDGARRIRMAQIAAGSDNPAFYNDEAKALHAEAKYDEALAILKKAKQRGCDDDVTRTIEADILHASGRSEEAQAQRLAQIAAGTDNPVFYNDAALAMMNAGDAIGALALLDDAASKDIGSDFTDAIRANALTQSGQIAKALALRQQKIANKSRNVVFYADQANSYFQQGEYSEAMAVLELARERGLDDGFTANIRAKVLRKLGP